MVNPGGQELPLQEWHVPTVLMTMSGVFGASCILLLVLLASYWRRGRSSIHLLMTLVLFFKSAVLFLEWCDRMLIVHTGRQAMISSVGYKILDKVHEKVDGAPPSSPITSQQYQEQYATR